MDDVHSCSYYCHYPECIKAQRDELVDKFVKAVKAPDVVYSHGWNAALDEAAMRIGQMKFGQATQDSFAVYIRGLKK